MTLLFALISTVFASDTSIVTLKSDIDAWIAHQKTTPFTSNADGQMGGHGGHLLGRQIIGSTLSSQHIGARLGVGFTEHLIHGPSWAIPATFD